MKLVKSSPGPQKIDPRWERLNELFFQASRLQGIERQAYVARETRGDAELERELLALLDCGPEKGLESLTRTLGGALGIGRDGRATDLVGRVIANYRLVSVLGRGGAGTVFLGERADKQFTAKAAVKVVDRAAAADLGMRFRAERQILASLNHPNIARLLDAGETEDGQPYLVMEHIQGKTLDRYCDEQRLDLRGRLKLFIDICAAVQYAHQNLIIHRDLKPANILVTEDGTAKLLDFGIAKLLNTGPMAPMAELTRMNDRLLTPEYASPEQIIGRTVTTASDIYSLGIVLYRLLAGLRPYDLSGTTSQLELERSICVVDPPRPSAIVQRALTGTPAEGEPTVAAVAHARSLSPERLHRRLVGDLDAIVMRALRKEPEHRYSSVERLVADIRHYLANEPVQARQGNWVYYTQRFVRRHTTAVAAGAGFVVFVVAVAIVMSIQRQNIATALEQATHDREKAERVSDFMLQVFSAADPFTNFGKEPTARVLLDRAARQIQSDLNEQPEVRAGLLEAIGRSYNRMGQHERAVTFLQDSLRIQERLTSVNDAKIGSIVTEIAIALRENGRIEDSDRYFSEAVEISRRSTNQRTEAHAQLLLDLGRLEKIRSNVKQALTHFNGALALMREIKGSKDAEVGAILNEISNTLSWSDDLVGAEAAAREAVEIFKGAPPFHPNRVMADYFLGDVLLYRGRIDEAALLFERALSAQRRIYGSENNFVADTLGSLAQVRVAQNNVHEAEKLIREALAAHQKSGSTAYLKIGYLQTMLATIAMKQSKFADAEQLLRETLDVFAPNLPPDHQYIASAEHYLGEALLGQRKYKDAEPVLIAAMERWKRSDAPPWRSARSASALGEVLHKQGRTKEAEGYLAESFRQLSADAGADEDVKRVARDRLTRLYRDLGQTQKMDVLLKEGLRPRAPAAKSPSKHSGSIAKVDSADSDAQLTASEQ
jgi:serine/threonine protein kinase/tetratricopeptide (TPR) repeat protein